MRMRIEDAVDTLNLWQRNFSLHFGLSVRGQGHALGGFISKPFLSPGILWPSSSVFSCDCVCVCVCLLYISIQKQI